MAEENKDTKNDTVGLFLRAMVDREPGKRKVKPSKTALIDLAELDFGESSDDSDFNVDEEKLKDDDDISINSDPDACDDDDDDIDSEDDSNEETGQNGIVESKSENSECTVSELLQQANEKQLYGAHKNSIKILVCAVCLGDYSDDTNEIVICDGCHVSVHEGCYGISDTISISSTISSSSTEPWFCDSCKSGVTNPSCELCPNLGHTIFKETEMGRWVHLVCALYIPGIAFSEVDKLSFPTLFEMPYSRWGAKTCSLCEDERYCKTGVCIGCDAGMCRAYFHVTCAQREGLLSEVNHGEADQADPYYAHCKLHTDRELIKRRKRNWLALQLRMKQGEIEKQSFSQEIQERLQRKLLKYKEKYLFSKSNRPTPWFPTQKMPRSLSTCASLFRSLLNKTKLMGLETESPIDTSSLGDIRKKWHIPPAFNIEFISYYIDRNSRLQDMKSRLEFLLKENEGLVSEEASLRDKYNVLDQETKEFTENNETLLKDSLGLHDLLKGLAGRPLRLPTVLAALQPPFIGVDTSPSGRVGSVGKGKKVLTKAAAKMITDSPAVNVNGITPSGSMKQGINKSSSQASQGNSESSTILNLHKCSVCLLMRDQHLMILCDTCINYYHLACLDPPLSRMPKKTKQMGWQCSDCCKSSDSDKAPEIDTAAPRRLRRIIKEPAKFSTSVATDQKTVHERSIELAGPVAAARNATCMSPNQTPEKEKGKLKTESKTPDIKNRRSSETKEAKKGKTKKIKKKKSESQKAAKNASTPKKGYKSSSILKECKLEVYPLPKIDKGTPSKQKNAVQIKEEPEKSPPPVNSPNTPAKARKRRSTQDSFSDSSPSSPARKKIALDLKDEKIKGGESTKSFTKMEAKKELSQDPKKTLSDEITKDVKPSERKSIEGDVKNGKPLLEGEAIVKISDVVLYPEENGIKTENNNTSQNQYSASKKIKREESEKESKGFGRKSENLGKKGLDSGKKSESPVKKTAENLNKKSHETPGKKLVESPSKKIHEDPNKKQLESANKKTDDILSKKSTQSPNKKTTEIHSKKKQDSKVMETEQSAPIKPKDEQKTSKALLTESTLPLAEKIKEEKSSPPPKNLSTTEKEVPKISLTISSTTSTPLLVSSTTISISKGSSDSKATSTIASPSKASAQKKLPLQGDLLQPSSKPHDILQPSSSLLPNSKTPQVQPKQSASFHSDTGTSHCSTMLTPSKPLVEDARKNALSSLPSLSSPASISSLSSPNFSASSTCSSRVAQTSSTNSPSACAAISSSASSRGYFLPSTSSNIPSTSSSTRSNSSVTTSISTPITTSKVDSHEEGANMCPPSKQSTLAPENVSPASTTSPNSQGTPSKIIYSSFFSGSHLDISAESLPSASSLNSPRSEPFHSAEDDPLSPRKEKKHRDGSKKKKKDKDKDRESDGSRKRKKHHHRNRHNLAEITSEMVSPFRIKIKSLPPRPVDQGSLDASYTQILNAAPTISLAPHTTSTTTAPPGYPPLPPGYTLTQPMAISSPTSTSSNTPSPFSSTSNSSTSGKVSQLPSVTVVTSGTATISTLGTAKPQVGRRKSDPSGEQFSKCDVCSETGGVTNTVTCDECLKAYHFNCLEPPLKKSPKRRGYSWFCEDCDGSATSYGDSK